MKISNCCTYVVPNKKAEILNLGFLVPGAGLEPALPQWQQDFKSCVSTSSTTWALKKNPVAETLSGRRDSDPRP